jgi:hypothetical protein
VVCILGGGVAATVLFLICISLFNHGLDHHWQIIDRCLPFVRVIGGVFGGLVMYRSEQRVAQCNVRVESRELPERSASLTVGSMSVPITNQ